jgi:hypothetical protein
MTVADSLLSPATISSTLASLSSEARRSQPPTYGNRAGPKDGDGEDRVAIPPALQHWPRIFPGL